MGSSLFDLLGHHVGLETSRMRFKVAYHDPMVEVCNLYKGDGFKHVRL